jgi:hypothetical protein
MRHAASIHNPGVTQVQCMIKSQTTTILPANFLLAATLEVFKHTSGTMSWGHHSRRAAVRPH